MYYGLPNFWPIHNPSHISSWISCLGQDLFKLSMKQWAMAFPMSFCRFMRSWSRKTSVERPTRKSDPKGKESSHRISAWLVAAILYHKIQTHIFRISLEVSSDNKGFNLKGKFPERGLYVRSILNTCTHTSTHLPQAASWILSIQRKMPSCARPQMNH